MVGVVGDDVSGMYSVSVPCMIGVVCVSNKVHAWEVRV